MIRLIRWLFSRAYMIIFSLFAFIFFGGILTAGLFVVLEMYPDLLGSKGLSSIPYYALRHRYVADKELIFRNKPNSFFQGMIGSEIMDDPTLSEGFTPIPYKANFTGQGFRPPTVGGQVKGVMIGDSFIEAGETDDSTLPALLSKALNQNIKNLGTSWYGPDHYLRVLKRYGVPAKPDFAFFCFFEGNDIRDMKAFETFKVNGSYYDFKFHENSALARYLTVLRQGSSVGMDLIHRYVRVPLAKARGTFFADNLKKDTLHVSLQGNSFWDIFDYEPDTRPFEQLIADPQWRRLRGILKNFKEEATTAGIRPIVLFIPAKLTIYKEFATEQSGSRFQKIRELQLANEGRAEKLLQLLASKSGLEFVSLTETLLSLARRGERPFYRYDTHWNKAGRLASATHLKRYLEETRNPASSDVDSPEETAPANSATPPGGLRMRPPSSFDE